MLFFCKIGEDPSGVPLADKAANAPSTSGANEANRAQQDDGVHLGTENGKADHVQEGCARQQEEPVERSTDGQLPEKSVTSKTIKGKDKATSSNVTGEIAPDNNKSQPVTSSKPSLMERNPTASAFEVIISTLARIDVLVLRSGIMKVARIRALSYD
jgi:hypothetical protein